MMNTSSVVAYFLPIGFVLIAWGSLPPARARLAAGHGLMVAGLATLAYAVCGFAFQFGGLGLSMPGEGYAGLRSAYALLDSGQPAWSIVGLRGFLLESSIFTPEAAALFIHHLPLVMAAALIPTLALAGRARSIVLAVLTVCLAGLAYPLLGHWLAAGGWLASLGARLQFGHGAIDMAGAGPVYLLGGLVAMVGLIVFGPRVDLSDELPPAHFPLLAVLGGLLFGLGWMGWLESDPLHGAEPALNVPLAMANGLLSAAAATVVAQVYSWLATSRIDPLMAARGWLAGWIVVSGGAPFIAAWVALVLGALAGIWLLLGLFIAERALRRSDATSAIPVCGLIGLLAVLAPGVLADGNWGAGWNGVGIGEYLAVKGQGVTGALAPAGFVSDPGQLTAQLLELAAVGCLAMLVAWSVLGLLRLVLGARAVVSDTHE